MKFNYTLLLLCFVTALLLSACSGEEGPPGPQGEIGASGTQGDKGEPGENGEKGETEEGAFKHGYFDGTIKGQRKDGTPFTEYFKHEYTFTGDKSKWGTYDLIRFETYTGAVQYDLVTDQYGNNNVFAFVDKGYTYMSFGEAWDPHNFNIKFEKVLSATQLFRLEAAPYIDADVDFNSAIEISMAWNQVYGFKTKPNGGNLIYYQVDTDGNHIDDAFQFETDGFSNVESGPLVRTNVCYDMVSGELKSLQVWAIDPNTIEHVLTEEITNGTDFDKYNEIRFVENATDKTYNFENAATGEPMGEYIGTVLADEFFISDFKRDEITGIITFNYSMKISKYAGYIKAPGGFGGWLQRGANTTMHDLEITGSFNSGGPIYDEVVSRTKD